MAFNVIRRRMFRGEQEQRTNRQNAALAGSLALVAGLVNTLGFLQGGVFTSHVTGHAGQLTIALTLHGPSSAWPLAARILAFFGGALFACLAIEGARYQRKPYAYSALLVLEAGLLSIVLLEQPATDFATIALCMAMGLQNGLVTRLSGAVVRTTHLTGVVTDLGIEAARWLQLVAWRAWTRLRGPGAVPRRSIVPQAPKAMLLLTILGAFLGGGSLGSALFTRIGPGALLTPILLLLIGAAMAFRNGMESLGPENRK